VTTNYDFISEQYKRAKLQPWRAHVEAFTFLRQIGDLNGKSVLDLACGEGFYSRILKERGAAEVTGIDLSEKMIELARKQEQAIPLQIDYKVGDAKNLVLGKKYDLVVAAYLLNYARNSSELLAMFQTIADCLKPGGRFVTVNSNPGLDFSTAPSFRQYGFETIVLGPWKEETPVQWKFHLKDGTIEIENYYLNIATHEDASRAAGLHSISCCQPSVSEEGKRTFGEDYWSRLLAQPPLICMECSK
jgi:ubiquinone/menaquinone biosynthesis C-methylase UbiE